MRLFKEDWFSKKRLATSEDISYMGYLLEQRDICEGIGLDSNEQLTFDYTKDRPDDFVKFFDGLVQKLGPDLYAGFTFSSVTKPMLLRTLEPVARKVRLFCDKCQIVKEQMQKSNQGYFDPNDEITKKDFKKIILNSREYENLEENIAGLIDLVVPSDGRLVFNRSDVFRIISDRLALKAPTVNGAVIPNFDVEAFKVVFDQVSRPRRPDEARQTLDEMKRAYDALKNGIIKSLNANDTSNAEMMRLIDFAAVRLAEFIMDGGFGFEPSVFVAPKSASVGRGRGRGKSASTQSRSLLHSFGEKLGRLTGIPFEVGISKTNRNVYFDDGIINIPLTDANGNVANIDPRYASKIVGMRANLGDVAQKISDGKFKITGVFTPNRQFFKNFMQVEPEFAKLYNMHKEADEDFNILLLDDSMYSGTTQRAMIEVLKNIGAEKVAGYAVIKT